MVDLITVSFRKISSSGTPYSFTGLECFVCASSVYNRSCCHCFAGIQIYMHFSHFVISICLFFPFDVSVAAAAVAPESLINLFLLSLLLSDDPAADGCESSERASDLPGNQYPD